MSAPLFGWDLLVKSVQSELKSADDYLLCFTHLVLISNDFKCIGLGESKVFDGNENKSEALPPGWSEAYALRYLYQGRLYNLKCTKLDDGIMVNLIRVDERTSSLVQLNKDTIHEREGSLEKVFPTHSALADLIKTQLIEKVVNSTKSKETSSQTEGTSTFRPIFNSAPQLPISSPLLVEPRGFRPPVGVGEFDLNPFGRNPFPLPGALPQGGGMLFQPPGAGFGQPPPDFGLPPGAVPPGARFDPFRPPDAERFPRRNNRPDNDEMPPPGYDDMFM